MQPLLRGKFKLAAVLAVISAAAVVAGVVSARLVDDGGAPPLANITSDEAAGATSGPNGEPLVVHADPAVQFPPGIAKLDNPPSHLAVDPNSGDLWFLIFTYDGSHNSLFHYTAASQAVETFTIPSSTGSEPFSAIAVESHGHVLFAEGNLLTDFDPSSKTSTQFALPEPTTAKARYSPRDGTQVLDIAVSDWPVIFLTRINVPAITEFDMSTSKVRELAYPPEFGPAYDIQLAEDGLWATSRWNIPGVSTAETWYIDRETGVSNAVGPGTTALAQWAGQTLGIRSSEPETPSAELVAISRAGLAPVIGAENADSGSLLSGLGLFDFLAVDQNSGSAWLIGEGADALINVDLKTGQRREYQLPIYGGVVPRCPPPGPDSNTNCPGSVDVNTTVRGLVVAPNGDLYFADATLNRIGVVRAGE